MALGLGVSEPAEAQSGWHELRVAVADEEGRPVGSLWVGAFVHHDSPGVYQSSLTGADGVVRFRLVEGMYHLHVLTDRFSECTVAGQPNPERRLNAVFPAAPGGSSEIRITLAATYPTSESTWIACRFDLPFYSIEGRVLGPGGASMSGLHVRAFGEHGERFGPWPGTPTSESGHFAVEVPAGAYLVEFHVVIDGTECQLGYADPDGEHTYGHPGRVTVDGAGVGGLTVRLPGTVTELCRPIEGIVTNGGGEPLGNIPVAADGRSPLVVGLIRANGASRPDGTFTLYAPAGRYRILVATTAGRTCEVAGHGRRSPGQGNSITVGASGVSGIGVAVSGEPSDQWQSLTCSLPPEVVTTRLRPGWNLAGWPGTETSPAALFEAIPALNVVYAWDGETQKFKAAFREGPALPGALETVEPGMGLWLAIEGTEEVTWTRPLSPDSALASLSEGWNLVAWVGGEGIAIEEALAPLGSALHEAATRDAKTGALVSHPSGDVASLDALPALKRGDTVWLNLAEERRWLQPGSVTPIIDFVGEIGAEVRASWPTRIESILAYFAERYGVLLPEVIWLVGQTPALIALEPDFCGGYAAGTVYLTEQCTEADAHEYSHAIQEHVAGADAQSPAWLIEGIANRWEAEYYDATGERSYESHLAEVVLPQTRRTPIALEAMEHTLFIDDYAGANYSAAHLAIDWLVTLAGEDRTFDYFRQVASRGSWRDAFEEVFGIGVQEFYASFAAHRAEVAAPLAVIDGVVLDSEGDPLPGVWLQVVAIDGRIEAVRDSRSDGAFSLPVGDGEYLLELHTSGEEGRQRAGWYAGKGRFTLQWDEARTLRVPSDGISGLELLFPDLASRRVAGVVRDAIGKPLAGVSVSGERIGGYTGSSDWTVTTDAEGRFDATALAVPFRVRIEHDHCFSGWYGEGGMLQENREAAVEFPAVNGDVMAVDIKAPHLCSRIQGVVVGPGGESATGVLLVAHSIGGEHWWQTAVGERGMFDIVVAPGPYWLSLRVDGCPLDWTASASELRQVSGREMRLSLTHSHVVGLTLQLTASPSETCRRIAGVVVGPNDAPAAGEWVAANPVPHSGWGEGLGWSSADGSFSLSVRDGSYLIDLFSESFSTCMLSLHEGAPSNGRARLEVDGDDIVGVRITVGGDPAEGGEWHSCWFAEE